ncbi:hypothetical protein [Ramlibacter rhizophilus]|uniref:Uncharacterized protein n=1 Tax=Ramlibacter rhizophilus TaxID=1781167 RepID=A0A4Z0BN12_9BURK|nr:hypothetical protein [Ramlibacter rhizophilus]TFY99809.1 hypothetical protein EZ242_11785 [Ramlibacter rhizophilus]
MDTLQPAIWQPNGDLLIPARTAQVLQRLLHQLQDDIAQLHGQTMLRSGEMETPGETAQRQDYVDKLSASAGQASPVVSGRHMPQTQHASDNSELLERLQTLSALLKGS